MDFKEVLSYWKAFITLILVVAGAIFSVLTWADETLQQQKVLIEARAALIHDNYYQEGRIARKEDQIGEHQRELENILEYIGDDEPTIRQSREIDYLDGEISRLRHEIEEIRVLIQSNE